MSVQKHKKFKELKNQNLRDHMTEAELIFTALAELSTRQFAESMDARGLPENKVAGKKGGGIAKNARLELEQKTEKKVVSMENYLKLTKESRLLAAKSGFKKSDVPKLIKQVRKESRD